MRKAIIQFVLFGALLALMSEILLRVLGSGSPPLAVLDADIEYYAKPSQTYRRFGNNIAINRHGMRSEDWGLDLPAKRRHIAIFGDSIVYGTHDLDQKQTIAARLQLLLSSHWTNKPLVSSIAASSWGPKNMLEFYKKNGPFPGALAIVVLSSHDKSDYPTFESGDIPYRLEAPYGALHDFLMSVWLSRRRYFPVGPKGSELSIAERIRLTDQALDELIDLLKRDFDNTMLVFHPAQSELGEPAPTEEFNYLLTARKHDVKFLSLRQPYTRASNAGVRIYTDGLHLSADGALIVAGLFAEIMASRGSRDD